MWREIVTSQSRIVEEITYAEVQKPTRRSDKLVAFSLFSGNFNE